MALRQFPSEDSSSMSASEPRTGASGPMNSRPGAGKERVVAPLAWLEAHASSTAVALLITHAALLAWSATRHSPTVDEVAHLPAGIAIWHYGRFDLYRVNPPLVKTLAALPVVLSRPTTDWRKWNQRPGGRSAWIVGRDFIAHNKPAVFWYFTLARWACIPLSLIGAYVCYRWGAELYRPAAGILALTLWCFCPNVLAYGALILPDVGAATMGVLAAYSFWRWLRRPELPWALAAGCGLGAALLTKMTWIILLALWPILWSMWVFVGRRSRLDSSSWRSAAQLALILAMGLYLLNLGYGFQGSFRRLGDYIFFSKTLAGSEAFDPSRQVGSNRFSGTWSGALPVPLPEAFVTGLDYQRHDFDVGKWSYLRGEFRYGGWWYYYIYALLVKVPLGVWTLFAIAIWITLRGSLSAESWRNEMVLLAPGLSVLAVVSAETGFTIFLRYVLPLFPFVFVWLGKVAVSAVQARKLAAITGVSLLWFANSSLWYYPHGMSYFNELAGGPNGGPDHLLDGNIDWGQDLLHLKQWSQWNRQARPLHVAFYGQVDPRHADVRFELPPRAPLEPDGSYETLRRRSTDYVSALQRHREEEARLASAVRASEEQFGVRLRAPRWQILAPAEVESGSGARLLVEPDSFFRTFLDVPDGAVVSVVLQTQLTSLTAVRIEVDRGDDSTRETYSRSEAEHFGGGDFLLAAIDRRGVRRPIPLRSVSPGFSNGTNGSALSAPPLGARHITAYETAEEISIPNGARLILTLRHQQGVRKTARRLRIAASSDERFNLNAMELLAIPAAERSIEQQTAVRELTETLPSTLVEQYEALAAHAAQEPEPPSFFASDWLQPGWYAVSVNLWRGMPTYVWGANGERIFLEHPYFAYFQEFERVAQAGYSIYIFHITPAEANRVRRKYGLPLFALD